MSDLRNELIRLAHSNPKLRSALLPILMEDMKESGFLSDLWNKYKKDHPQAKKPPKSLEEKAKKMEEKAKEEDGKKEEPKKEPKKEEKKETPKKKEAPKKKEKPKKEYSKDSVGKAEKSKDEAQSAYDAVRQERIDAEGTHNSRGTQAQGDQKYMADLKSREDKAKSKLDSAKKEFDSAKKEKSNKDKADKDKADAADKKKKEDAEAKKTPEQKAKDKQKALDMEEMGRHMPGQGYYASLRNQTIRLAHAKPHLRKHLLPLLKS